MPFVRSLFYTVAHERRWWWALLLINLFGSLYGFYWYRHQLASTPARHWLIVPDSPGSTFLLCIWLALMLGGADWRKPGMQVLGAIAFVSNMKYGLWTATVLPEGAIKFGWTFDDVHLSLSHAAMFVQGMLFTRYYPPRLVPAVAALLWMWVQDVVDYRLLMTHPTLPYDSEFGFARAMAIGLSTVWGGAQVAQALFDRRSART